MAIENWHEIFIRLSYPQFKINELSKYLGINSGTLRQYINNKLKLTKIKVYKGQTFGKLKVEKLYTTDPKRGKIWLCKCECGNYMKAETNTLLSEHSSSCGCGRIDAISKKVGEINGQWFCRIKKAATKKNLEFDLTKDYLNELYEKQNGRCALTKIPIKINFGNQATGSTASLDRINPQKGYTKDNVQFLHVDVNYMKNVFSQEYFIYICNLITDNNERTNINGDSCRQHHIQSTKTRQRSC